jgi:hypothetical protein
MITPSAADARILTAGWDGSRFRLITADCMLVGAVQPAVLSAILAVAVVLKLVLMPDDARLLDGRVLVIIHMHTSPHH